MVVYVIFKNLPSNFYCLSMYYQTISFLNTKNNLILLIFIKIVLLQNWFKGNTPNNTLVFFLTSWCVYINMFLEVPKLTFSFLVSTATLNTNLLNGIMLIHPMVLYVLYGIYLLEYKVSVEIKIKNTRKNVKYKNFYKIFLCVYIVIMAILLGAWWAEQELSWGGWWSWDFVELLSINYLLYLLVIIHSKSTSKKVYNNYNLQILLFITAVFSVRYNIINSIHNFISIESQNQYYYYIIFVLVCCVFFIFKILLFKKNVLVKYTQQNFFLLILLVFFLCFVINIRYIFGWLELQINLLKNIKLVILYVVVVYIVFWALNHQFILSFVIFVCFIFKSVFTFFDIFVLSVVLYNLKKSKNTFKKNKNVDIIHNTILTSFLISTHQIYNFIPIYKYTVQLNIYSDCINNFKLNNLNGCFVSTDKKTNSDIITGLFKNIFEKTIQYYNNGLFLEVYNYNHQTLIQLYGGGLFFILVSLLLLTTILVYCSTNSLQQHLKI